LNLPSYAIDNQLLVTVCQDETRLYRLSVDDFDDANETEVTNDQIHLTIVRMRPGPEEPLPVCMKMSTTSALQLIRELETAVSKRGGGA
jgi:hypothetical protein